MYVGTTASTSSFISVIHKGCLLIVSDSPQNLSLPVTMLFFTGGFFDRESGGAQTRQEETGGGV